MACFDIFIAALGINACGFQIFVTKHFGDLFNRHSSVECKSCSSSAETVRVGVRNTRKLT